MPTGQNGVKFRSETIVQKLTLDDYFDNPTTPFLRTFNKTLIVPDEFDSIQLDIFTESIVDIIIGGCIFRKEITTGKFANMSRIPMALPSNLFGFPPPQIHRMTIGMSANGNETFNSINYNPDGVDLIPVVQDAFGDNFNTVVPITSPIILTINAQGLIASTQEQTLFITYFRA